MFTVRGAVTWYCGGTLWTATFSKQRVNENFEESLSDSGPLTTVNQSSKFLYYTTHRALAYRVTQ